MVRVLLLLAALTMLSGARVAAQDGTGRLHVGITILEPVSTDRSGPPTVHRSRNALDVALPAAAAVRPIVSVTVEREGRVAECPPRPGGDAAAPRHGMHRAACPLATGSGDAPTRIRMVIVPVA